MKLKFRLLLKLNLINLLLIALQLKSLMRTILTTVIDPLILIQPLIVMENVPIGTRFGQFFGVSDDLNASFNFHILDPNSLFEIDDMGFLKTRVALDYDHRDLYNLKLK